MPGSPEWLIWSCVERRGKLLGAFSTSFSAFFASKQTESLPLLQLCNLYLIKTKNMLSAALTVRRVVCTQHGD